MRVWLRRRPSAAPVINSWVGDTHGAVRPPAGTTNLILDTPGGLHGLALAKVAMVADAIFIPVSGSLFDRESASDCWAELRQHPRVKNGRCAVASIGTRLDARTHAEEVTRDWSASVGLYFIGCLRTSQLYVRAVENGLSIFDMPLSASAADREQWQPVVAWLGEHVFHGSTVAQASAPHIPNHASRAAPIAMASASPSSVILARMTQVANVAPASAPEKSTTVSGIARWMPSIFRRKA